MVIESGIATVSISILGLIWKASDLHAKLKVLVDNDKLTKERVNNLADESIRITEALDRSFVSRELVYSNFMTIKAHEDSMIRLEEKLVTEMAHMNESLSRLCDSVEKMTAR